jgi:hypothetical protein
LLYSEWMTRLRTWLTSAWNACVLGVWSAMAAANLPTLPILSSLGRGHFAPAPSALVRR